MVKSEIPETMNLLMNFTDTMPIPATVYYEGREIFIEDVRPFAKNGFISTGDILNHIIMTDTTE